MSDKKTIEELLKFEGDIRGMDLKTDAIFVLEKSGQAGLKEVKRKLKSFGVNLDYAKIKSMAFYPGGWRALSLIAIKEALNYSDEEIREMGEKACKGSLIVKLFLKYFGSKSRFFFKESLRLWSKYWTVGEFIPLELDEETKRGSAIIKGLNLHPLYCLYLEGYFMAMIKMVSGGRKTICRETKCFFKGDDYHQYLIQWE